MLVARLFSKIFKEGGIILIDYRGQKYKKFFDAFIKKPSKK